MLAAVYKVATFVIWENCGKTLPKTTSCWEWNRGCFATSLPHLGPFHPSTHLSFSAAFRTDLVCTFLLVLPLPSFNLVSWRLPDRASLATIQTIVWWYFGSAEMQQHLVQHLLCLPSKVCQLCSMFGGWGPYALWTLIYVKDCIHEHGAEDHSLCRNERAVEYLHSQRSLLALPKLIWGAYLSSPHSVL